MNITKEWLQQNGACEGGTTWFLGQKATRLDTVVQKLLKEGRFDWANWALTRAMTHRQKVQYALFAAEQVIEIYEKQYPGDDRPRKAIEAAKHFVATGDNSAAYAAAYAAYAAYAAAARAAYAADAAARAAYAADAAYAAARAAYAADAAYAAYAAADAAARAAYAGMKKKIINYGLRLLAKKGAN